MNINQKVIEASLAPALAKFGDEYYLVPAFVKIPPNVDPIKYWEKHYNAYFKDKPVFKMKEKVWRVRSSSDPNKVYIVKYHGEGFYSCTCPGFNFRSHCKHIDQVAKNFKIRR